MSDVQIDQLEREMIRLGKSLVTQFFVLMKTAYNYAEGHGALRQPVANLMHVVKEIQRRNEEASLRLKGSYLLLGEYRLKPDAAGFEAFKFIMAEMKRYYIGAVHFGALMSELDLTRFACLFKEVEPIPTPQTFDKICLRMQQRMITTIEIESLGEDGTDKGDIAPADLDEGKTRAKRIYAQTLHAASEVMDNAKMGQTLRLRKSKRVVQNLIDQLLAAESNLLGLTTIHCHDEYTYHHSVNVCILSLVIGQRLGFSKVRLCELGMAALFHDIGKADIPQEILNKPTEFTPEEWGVMQQHPILGVRKLMKLKGLDSLSANLITGAFEHHLNCDFSGYPKLPYKRLSLFGRIISIADCYDGLTSSRVYSRVPYPPEKALRFMLARSGKMYDPVILKLFINCVGIYPAGTLALLDSRELAVVLENNPDPARWNMPLVRIIADSHGREVDGGVFDLAAPEAGRAIAETLDPNRYKIDVSRFFL